MIEASAQIVVNRYSGASQYPEEWDLPALVQDMAAYLPEDTPTEEAVSYTHLDVYKRQPLTMVEDGKVSTVVSLQT